MKLIIDRVGNSFGSVHINITVVFLIFLPMKSPVRKIAVANIKEYRKQKYR